jgi:glycosyltransferase involved in cell wall biosynthesis
VHIRIYHVLRLLSHTFDITALCFYRRQERPTPDDVAAGVRGLAPWAAVRAFPIPDEYSRWRLVWDHARSVCARRPYTWYTYESRDFAAALRSTLHRERFDLVQLDSLDLAAYLPMLGDLPVVCVHHNVESALLRRRADAERRTALRWYIRHQAGLLQQLERQWCDRVACNVTVSAVDLVALRREAPAARFVEVPNGVDVNAFRPEPGAGRGIVSVGGINWFPNRDALEHLAHDILPAVRAAAGDVATVWVGRADDEWRERYRARHGIQLTGYVPDIRPYVRDAACFVVPLRVGGGTRLKILDAWAMGKAVVSTSVGCEGLAAVDGENILIRDDPREFAGAVTRVLGDAALRIRLGHAARLTAERRYSWAAIGERMRRIYLDLLREMNRAPEVTA